MASTHSMPMIFTVREPEQRDTVLGARYHPSDGQHRTYAGEHVYAVLDVGEHLLPITTYIDWWGDGGPTAHDAAGIVLAQMYSAHLDLEERVQRLETGPTH